MNFQRFFGLVRQVCGSNDHPDSCMFAQIFRLLNVYSLIKPRRGSNVEVVDILNAMLTFKDLDQDQSRENLCLLLDKVISDNDPVVEKIPTVLDKVKDHDQRLCRTPDFAQGFVAGYVAFRAKKLTKCDNCIQNVQNKSKVADERRSKMIDACDRGRLQYPSRVVRVNRHARKYNIAHFSWRLIKL